MQSSEEQRTTPASPEYERRRVLAENPSGAPLHPAARDSRVIGRLAHGLEVQILERAGHWVRVAAGSQGSGWIIERYLAPRLEPATSAPTPLREPQAPAPALTEVGNAAHKSAREACFAKVRAGERVPRLTGHVRIASWNLRWFPDGGPGLSKPRTGGTDLEWLACELAYLDAELVAVQEIKTYPGARQRTDAMLSYLSQFTGQRFRMITDPCPNLVAQHVGLLINTARVRATHNTTYAMLNPLGEACRDQLRPGYGAYFSFPGGLDLRVISVHFKSGADARAQKLRTQTFAALSAAYRFGQDSVSDEDVLLLGDFNVMGCRECQPALTAEQEQAELELLLAQSDSPFRWLKPGAACSEYHEGRSTLLDLALVARASREFAGVTQAHAGGLCAARACSAFQRRSPPPEYEYLSDHCPIYVDVPDRDLD